eukprot:TRINITY_DN10711_c0_g2_i1.p1 TRINITY_DN10711_c0_g2~~TRINITY_DN10711_c0_g2_i1.p1  ORF type:complete len:200 (-),score=38.21 TRINITY_DN10711_c0_g2_i1:253-852(-)
MVISICVSPITFPMDIEQTNNIPTETKITRTDEEQEDGTYFMQVAIPSEELDIRIEDGQTIEQICSQCALDLLEDTYGAWPFMRSLIPWNVGTVYSDIPLSWKASQKRKWTKLCGGKTIDVIRQESTTVLRAKIQAENEYKSSLKDLEEDFGGEIGCGGLNDEKTVQLINRFTDESGNLLDDVPNFIRRYKFPLTTKKE